ncbi:DHA2 family efflux MFS transporter permease subunit [Janthinobacterium sp. 17J80-10]|uniref:DHA2 family efflux MFS transporter permease subunit n=1 Tax=Janthinobacterium sp. 17J80-10 TaxID=2497863 RepID=UPI001005333C|nr:DHA2 family efflux MFS transporter permease subunit [Janthinobacterium sp. 17J80-10]QAU32683.1 DHA2 family efflux MFS transporter permease subunit [Janthinobacterium sp. 17J80-10]
MPLTLEELRSRHGERYKWLVLITVLIGTTASIMSSTIVNVAIPDLSRHFALGQERVQWVATSFMLAMTLSMLLTPWMLQRFGLRHTYIGTILLLLVGGVVGAMSVNYAMLLSMRVLEGLASGILQPIPAIIIMRSFDAREQGKAMGIFGFGVVLAPAIAPAVGGILVEHFGWRSIFLVVVPFCLIVLALSRRYLAQNAPMMGSNKPLDWRGLLLMGVATVSLLNGLVALHSAALQGSALLLLGVVCLIGFVAYQRRAVEPLLSMKLFAYRQFASGALVAFIYGMSLFGSTYLLPVYMQSARHYAPSTAGLILLPAGIVLALVIPLGGRLADRIPANLLVSGGLALMALSFVLMALGTPTTHYLAIMAWVVIGRIGLGLVVPALSLGALRGIESDLIAQGASAMNFLRQLGGAIGVSVAGVVLQWRLAAHQASPDSQIRAFDETFIFVAAACIVAMVAAWGMKPRAIK